jgi:hypothetical protein
MGFIPVRKRVFGFGFDCPGLGDFFTDPAPPLLRLALVFRLVAPVIGAGAVPVSGSGGFGGDADRPGGAVSCGFGGPSGGGAVAADRSGILLVLRGEAPLGSTPIREGTTPANNGETMMRRLIDFFSLLAGLLTVVLIVAIWVKNLGWWAWIPVQFRLVVLALAAAANLAAIIGLLTVHGSRVNRYQRAVMLLNVIGFLLITILLGGALYLQYYFRM